MSQSPPNYMEGVPVKISERFRPPPKVTLPQSVINRLAQVDGGGSSSSRTVPSYDFELEETVLKRIGEWRAAKDKQLYERGERIRRKELELARLAEEEQKRKLNQICYPETDDLSSASEEEGEDEVSEENDESIPSGSSEEQVAQIRTSAAQYSQFNKFDTILIPTVLPELATANRTSASDELITSGGGLTTNNVHIPKSTNLLNNNNYNKINYSDFENDTSSPFDNMELKTMNDLDILAQVLNLNAPSSGSERSPEETNDSKPKPIEEAVAATTTTTIEQATVPTVQQPQYSYGQTTQQYQPGTYSMPTQPQQPPSSNDYYKSYNSYHYNYCAYTPTSTSTATSCYTPTSGAVAAATVPYHSPSTQYQYQPTAAQYSYYPYTSAATAGNSPATQPTYAHNYLYNNAAAAASYYNYPAGQSATPADEASSLRSKSKSVPDIVRQLDEEVQDSAMRRTRNNSQSTAERRLEDDAPTVHTPAVTTGSNARTDFTLYNQLSAGEQNLVKRIGSMGFPLERVAAVLKRLGSDDKKIVEHLIPLSELLDLGFEEEKISEALVKFGNNKHKALDYLIS
uniref:(northern house mosquito) hypothetical protein n=1 Tax=Culex pipiens TaxID=7175 RepID=A0A8D8D5S2_CULPI